MPITSTFGESVPQHAGFRADDRNLVVVPSFHANAQYYSTMSALVSGSTLVVADRFSASPLLGHLRAPSGRRPSLFAAPIRMLLAQPQAPLLEHRPRLAYVVQNVTPDQLRDWERRFGVPLLQICGVTEKLGWPVANPLHSCRDNMTIGRPALPFRCRIIGAACADVAPSVARQLLVHGVPGVGLLRGERDMAAGDT